MTQVLIVGDDVEKVLLIPRTEFDLVPKTIKSIRCTHKHDCGSALPLDICIGSCYLVLKYEADIYDEIVALIRQGVTLDIIEKYRESIQGFMVVEQPDENHTEIWDVCTSQEHRRKGVAKSLFRALLPLVSDYAWLGVDPSNPSWDAALHTYVSLGFAHPVLTTASPSGREVGLRILGLTFRKGYTITPSSDQIRQIKTTANIIRNLTLTGVCNQSFYFPPEVMQKLSQTVLETPEEEAGAIVVVDVNDDGNYVVNIPVDSVIRGDPGTWAVNAPDYPFVFHTHPQMCYLLAQCYIGWPSCMDMSTTTYMAGAAGWMAHAIFAFEGIYVVEITPAFAQIAVLLDANALHILSDIVKAFFLYDDIIKGDVAVRQECLSGLLSPDCLTADPAKKDQYIERFLQDSRLLTLHTLIDWGLSNPHETLATLDQIWYLQQSVANISADDALMFNIYYTNDWDGAVREGITVNISSGSQKCPIPLFDEVEQRETGWSATFIPEWRRN